jgi:excisionase family DNA binding protein
VTGIESFTAKEVAAMLGVSREFVLKMAKTEQWPSWKCGRVTRFFPEHLEQIKALGSRPVLQPLLTRQPRRRVPTV